MKERANGNMLTVYQLRYILNEKVITFTIVHVNQ